MWSFAFKRKFRMKGFYKTVQFKDVFTKAPGYESYKTMKPKLYQAPAKKTKKGKGKRNGKV